MACGDSVMVMMVVVVVVGQKECVWCEGQAEKIVSCRVAEALVQVQV